KTNEEVASLALNLKQATTDAITHLADSSNLILDPDLDSYHAMNAVTNLIPKATSQISSILYLKTKTTRDGFNKGDPIDYAYRVMSENLKEMEIAFEKVAVYDADFYEKNSSVVAIGAQAKELVKRFESLNSETDKTKILNEIAPSMDTLWVESIKVLDELLAQRQSNMLGKRNFMLLSVTIAWIFAALGGFFIQKNLSTAFSKLSNELGRVASGNQNLAINLQSAIVKNFDASSSSTAAIQETVAAMTEISSMLTATKNSIESAHQLTEIASKKSEKGTETMNQLESSMSLIESVNLALKDMTNIIQEIAAKTNVIDDIVFKTQLLSVNASIEAARAGHHGKGFAVVATEVANLSTISGSASREIRVLLDESKKRVTKIIDETSDSVRQGRETVSQAVTTFQDLSTDMQKISQHMSAILNASAEQEIGVRQTSIAMDGLNQAANTAMNFSKTSRDACEDMIKNSQTLGKINGDFSASLYGKGLTFSGNSSLVDLNLRSDADYTQLSGKPKVSYREDQDLRPKSSRVRQNSTGNLKILSDEKHSKRDKHSIAKRLIQKSKGHSASLGGISHPGVAETKLTEDKIRNAKSDRPGVPEVESSRFTWKSQFDIGIKSMNDDHKHLLSLMSKLEKAHHKDASFDSLSEILGELLQFTKRHFAEEEAFFDSFKFPQADSHKGIHKSLLSKLEKHASNFSTKGTLDGEFFEFLRTWLSAHIQGIDNKYAQYYLESSEDKKVS
ncbi:MAG: bacteriohemerythrin, partial [Proteobacteria bacterium]|nr:bacteriohemerythrin [Pseudomonadota bacterium]